MVIPPHLDGLAERIVAALQKEAANFSATGAAPAIDLTALQFTQVVDPESQLPGYQGVWRNARNERCGMLAINSDSSFYAEYDLFCPHPRDVRCFVEMVTVWGHEDTVRSEAKLIPSA
jgi:hypothetical protein